MSAQQMASPQPKPGRNRSTMAFWIAFAVTALLTLALIGLIIWLAHTLALSQLYIILSIIASIAVIVSTPIIVFFAITKWPSRSAQQEHHIPPTQAQPFVVQLVPPPNPSVPDPTKLAAPQPPVTSASNLPYPRNPFFTGRETLLKNLHDHFTAHIATSAALTQPASVNGLGGIGKTQLAIEYAYRYRDDYHFVLWANAASRDLLVASYVQLAHVLNLPERDEQDQNEVVEAVKTWLSGHDHWLLILDNADDLSLARAFFPSIVKGHILLTTRDHLTRGIARGFEVEQMNETEGAELLLRSAKLLAPGASLPQARPADQAVAKAIVQEFGGLPLALNQAGAYIEETGCSLSAYQEAYRHRQADLLKHRGRLEADYPASVATTWSLSFEQVEQTSPIAADLLRIAAFLAPDAIPEELIVEGAGELGPNLEALTSDPSLLNDALGVLLRFSLVRRNRDNQTFSIHRLVQAVLKANMKRDTQASFIYRFLKVVIKSNKDTNTQRLWAERAVRAVRLAFPDVKDIKAWPQCERLLPHALACFDLVNEYTLELPEAAYLLNLTAYYLQDHAQYPQAEPLFQRALAIDEKISGPEHPSTATRLNNLALLYKTLGKYEQAEPLYQRAIDIGEKTLGPQHPDLATRFNNLAGLYYNQGKYEQAEPLYQRALKIKEQQLGSEHPDVAQSLNNLANLYHAQGKYAQAEPLLQRAIDIGEKTLGPEHPSTATRLNNLANLYHAQGKYEQAEPLFQRALSIYEKVLPDHPDTVTIRKNYAALQEAMQQDKGKQPGK